MVLGRSACSATRIAIRASSSSPARCANACPTITSWCASTLPSTSHGCGARWPTFTARNGRPGIDPEAALRLMLVGFLLGIVHDRRLLREAQVNLAIRWFAGYGLHEALPDHSTLTRIRSRWGAERFRHIFQRTVQACVAAGIAKGEIVHVDASLIRADGSWESLAAQHVGAVAEANQDEAAVAERNEKQSGRYKKVCTTDPDASMATNARNRRLEPTYKQHAVVDDVRGVVLDVEVTTGEVNEGQIILERLDA